VSASELKYEQKKKRDIPCPKELKSKFKRRWRSMHILGVRENYIVFFSFFMVD